MSSTLDSLQASFREAYPDYAQRLDKANSPEELTAIHQSLIQETRAKLASVLNERAASLTSSDVIAPIALTKARYDAIMKATNRDDIRKHLYSMLMGMQELVVMQRSGASAVAAKQVISGILALGPIAYEVAGAQLVQGLAEAAAATAGVEAATVTVVCAIGEAIVISLAPFLFEQRNFGCLVLLINELDQELLFKNDYSEHGEPLLMTNSIPKSVMISPQNAYYASGLIAAEAKSAMIGTQYGFTMAYGATNLAFGISSTPLRKDKCYCGIGISAQEAAMQVDYDGRQTYEVTRDGITLSIKCDASTNKSTYYVARAYRKS